MSKKEKITNIENSLKSKKENFIFYIRI